MKNIFIFRTKKEADKNRAKDNMKFINNKKIRKNINKKQKK